MLVEIFYQFDEFCKLFQKSLISDKRKGRKNKLKLSEILTIMVMYHYSGYKTFKDYYIKHVMREWFKDFPNLTSYARFVELKTRSIIPLIHWIKIVGNGTCTGISFIDSFTLKACHTKRQYSHKVLKAVSGKGKTSLGWFYGLKLHLVINHVGEIIDFCITPGNYSR